MKRGFLIACCLALTALSACGIKGEPVSPEPGAAKQAAG